MKPFAVISIAAGVLSAFASCDNRPAPKFRVGDKVRVKVTREEGTVSLWTRFYREDHYFIRLPGSEDVFTPVRKPDPEVDAAFDAMFGPSWRSLDTTKKASWHDEGIFYDTDLERVR